MSDMARQSFRARRTNQEKKGLTHEQTSPGHAPKQLRFVAGTYAQGLRMEPRVKTGTTRREDRHDVDPNRTASGQRAKALGR